MTSVRTTSVHRAKADLATSKNKAKPDQKTEKPKEPTGPVVPSDAVEITEDGAGAGGGYKTVSPADDDGAGAGGGYETVNPVDDDGAGAGGGYKTVGPGAQGFVAISDVGSWSGPLTVTTTFQQEYPSFGTAFGGDFYSEWLHFSEDVGSYSASVTVSSPPATPTSTAIVTKPAKEEGAKS